SARGSNRAHSTTELWRRAFGAPLDPAARSTRVRSAPERDDFVHGVVDAESIERFDGPSRTSDHRRVRVVAIRARDERAYGTRRNEVFALAVIERDREMTLRARSHFESASACRVAALGPQKDEGPLPHGKRCFTFYDLPDRSHDAPHRAHPGFTR